MSMTQGAMPPPAMHPPMMAPHPPAMPPQGMPPQEQPSQPVPPPPPMVSQFNQPLFMSAIQLLRDEPQRGFRIDIETDSTIVPDQQGERKDAMDMVQAVGAFMQSALPMVQSMPAILPLLGKILLFMVRRFPISSELESAFEDAIAKLEQASGQGMPGQQGEQQAQQAKTAADQASAQAKIQVAQVQSQTAQLKAQNDLAVEKLRQQTALQSHQMDMTEIQQESSAQQANDQRDTQRALLEEQLAQQEHARRMTPPPAPAAGLGAPLAPQKLQFMAGPKQ